MAITLAMCNAGLMPRTSPAYAVVNKFLVPLAVPLLLLDADLRKVARNTGPLFVAFIIGSVGTVVGTVSRFALP
jgi:uncharacterized membrane protein